MDKISKDEKVSITENTAYLKFFKNGEIIIHKECYFFILTQFFLISTTVLHLMLLYRNISSEGVKIFLIILSSSFGFLTVIFFTMVSISNPGFYNTSNYDEEKDTVINDQNLFLRFCTTCKILKDVRVFHCRSCNLCIERHDHHCPWLSNCIGEKNHKLFLLSILFLYIHNTIILGEEIYLITLIYQTITNYSIFDKITVISLLTLSSLCFIFITILIGNQFFFICKNITTSEYKRNKYGTGVYPFDKGAFSNIKQFLFSISEYRKDISYNLVASTFLSHNSLVHSIDSKNMELVKEDSNNLEMSFNTNSSKNFS